MAICKTSDLMHEVHRYIERLNNATSEKEGDMISRKLENLAKELRRRCVDEDGPIFRLLERYGF